MGAILHSLINNDTVVNLLITALVGLIGFVGKLVWEQILKTKNTVAISVATYIVHFVEDKYGPNTGTGDQKRAEAVAYLVKELKMDPDKADKLVRATYNAVFNHPLVGNVLAPSPIA